MTTPIESAANRAKLQRAESLLRELLALSLRRGFFGSAAIELSIQDGTLQHIRCRVERLEK